jgi:uncharacterized protein YecT (DUF1311 family)
MKLRSFGCALLLACFSSAALGQRASDAEAACYKLEGHADARSCLEQYAKRSVATLETAEAALRTALTRRDEEPASVAREVAAFDAAAMRFRQYRATQCSFMASLAAGGNAASDRRLLCEIELNQTRASHLLPEHLRGV